MTTVIIIFGILGWMLYAVELLGKWMKKKIHSRESRQLALLYIATLAMPEAYEKHRTGMLQTMADNPFKGDPAVLLDEIIKSMKAPDPEMTETHYSVALQFFAGELS